MNIININRYLMHLNLLEYLASNSLYEGTAQKLDWNFSVNYHESDNEKKLFNYETSHLRQ